MLFIHGHSILVQYIGHTMWDISGMSKRLSWPQSCSKTFSHPTWTFVHRTGPL